MLRDCVSEEQAGVAAAEFVDQIANLRLRNGPIFWTVHNELPHVVPFRRQFLAMRAALARHADAILVHDVASIAVLAAQVEFDPARVRVLPHPSYLGRHEDEATLRAEVGATPSRRIQGFGWIRLQKGFGEMIGMLPATFLRERNAHIRISGHGAEATEVMARVKQRTDIRWDVRHVPDAEVPRLLRSAACVVLPYERVLTSGVALLAMSAGAVLVGVDNPHLRELLPKEQHRFLYARGDGEALRRAVDDILDLPPEKRRDLINANLEVARERRPARVASRLADYYEIVSAGRASVQTASS